MDRNAQYYEGLDASVPFVTLPTDIEYQYQPGYPEKVKDATGFVPAKTLTWNRLISLSLEVDGTTIPLDEYKREYADSQFVVLCLGQADVGSDTSDSDSSDDSGSSEEPVVLTYEATATFYDFAVVTVVLKSVYSDGSEVEYTYSGAVADGASQITLTERLDAANSSSEDIPLLAALAAAQPRRGAALSASQSNPPITATLAATLVPTSGTTGEDLFYYSVYGGSDKPTHLVTYKWYKADGSLHTESHLVTDGDKYPPTDATPYAIQGWSPEWTPPVTPGSGEVTADIESEHVLSAPDATELDLDWGIAGGHDTVKGFKWGHYFPSIVKVNSPAGMTLKGVYLVKQGEDSTRVYNTDALPCAPLTARIYEGGYSLEAHWMSSDAVVSDLTDLRAKVGVLPSPFAEHPLDRMDFKPSDPGDSNDSSDEPNDEVNFTTGFPQSFSTPLPEGRVVTRQMVNTIGNLGTQTQFFEQCGGFYTFDPGFAAAIDGYPEGALLQFVDPATGALRTVRSLKDKNKDNFLEDPAFIGSLVYSYAEGQKVSWVYADDNPIVSVKVDYSSYEDLSERIFVESGVPDLYEVPYDSYLQAFAVGSVDCSSLHRPQSEDVTALYSDSTTNAEYYVRINGLYYADGHGSSYLDVYHNDSQSFGSLLIGGFHPVTTLEWGGPQKIHHAVRICPLSAFSCGIMLSKGDKIRVRNVIAEKNAIVEMPTGKNNFVHQMVHGDDTIIRKYNYRFAALYKRGAVL